MELIKPISRRLLGSISGRLGRNVHQGAWAQTAPTPDSFPSAARATRTP